MNKFVSQTCNKLSNKHGDIITDEDKKDIVIFSIEHSAAVAELQRVSQSNRIRDTALKWSPDRNLYMKK